MTIDHYVADVASANDYYPFGMSMPGRDTSFGEHYRYGFNGKLKDNSIADVNGADYDYGFRIYDDRIGKFLSVDPLTKKYPELTPYQFASDRPIDGIDRDGLEFTQAGQSGTPSMTNQTQARDNTAVVNYPNQQARDSYTDITIFWDPQHASVGTPSTPSQTQQASNYIKQQNYDANKPDPNNWTHSKAINNLNNKVVVPLAAGATVVDGAAAIDAGFEAVFGKGVAKLLTTTSDAATEQALTNTRAALGIPPDVQPITVYRVFGGDSRAEGFSWTPVNPTSVADFRDAAGLPSGGASGSTNTANFLLEGQVNPANIIKSRAALPLDGNIGGLPEYIIDPAHVTITNFSILKP